MTRCSNPVPDMHELAICQSLINQLEQIVIEREAMSVERVVLGIGPLSGVEAQLLENAYPIASAGSCAEAAQLQIQILPVRVRCPECGCESEVPQNKLGCQQCGNWRTELVSGDEMLLLSVELETQTMDEPLH